MNKLNYKKIAKQVVETEIQALRKLRNSFGNSFYKAVDLISKCQNKLVLAGIGKSGLVSRKISATLSSIGTPSFYLHPGEAAHGDLGQISRKDILLILSYSGETIELKNIIQYANRNRITLIGIVSKKKSLLYRAADIKLYIPEVNEAGLGIVPTASTSTQLAIGDALAVACLNKKKFNKYDFSRLHPSGNLGAKLKAVEDLMLTGQKIPFINENLKMKDALKIITKKKLGVLIAQNSRGYTTGILTDGTVRRASLKNKNLQSLTVKKIMTKNPIRIEQDMLAARALALMNSKKITSLIINRKKNKNKTIGILHIHNILEANVQ